MMMKNCSPEYKSSCEVSISLKTKAIAEQWTFSTEQNVIFISGIILYRLIRKKIRAVK